MKTQTQVFLLLVFLLLLPSGCEQTISARSPTTSLHCDGSIFSPSQCGDAADAAAESIRTDAWNGATMTQARVARMRVHDALAFDEGMHLNELLRECNGLVTGAMNPYQRCVCDNARREADRRQVLARTGADTGTYLVPSQFETIDAGASYAGVYGVTHMSSLFTACGGTGLPRARFEAVAEATRRNQERQVTFTDVLDDHLEQGKKKGASK